MDAGELEGFSEEELCHKYDNNVWGNAGVLVPVTGSQGEDFLDMVAKEMAKKKQKMDCEECKLLSSGIRVAVTSGIQ